jgi:leader peptidase (prepilin peptidase)/N-methyltransferase
MALLFVYDAKWYLLPFSVNLGLIGLAIVYAGYRLFNEGITAEALSSLCIGIVIMAGLYFIFSLFGWVGLGDSILGLGLALLLGTWELAFLALFLANLLGCLVLIPLSIQKKLHRNLHIPFGPFLIVGTVISMLWGHWIIATVFTASDVFLNLLMV